MTVRRQRIAAYGIARESDRVLLVRIGATQWGEAGTWMLPGGGIDHGEAPEQAVVREFAEETGYDVAVVRLLEVGSDRRTLADDTDFHNVFALYEVAVAGGALRHENDGSTDQATWADIAALPDLPLLAFARAALTRWL